MTTRKFRVPVTRRGLLQAGAGLAGILATGRAPLYAQTTPKKLLWAHIVPPPESGAVAFDWMAKEFNARANGALTMEFHGGTLIPKELEIMNAVKTGNIAIGGPAGAAATVFPEMGVFLVPYLDCRNFVENANCTTEVQFVPSSWAAIIRLTMPPPMFARVPPPSLMPRRPVRQVLRDIACALARQMAREDYAAEQAKERAALCESPSTPDSALTSRTSDR